MRRWLHTLTGKTYERELESEIAHHLEQRIDDLIESGRSRAEAERQARQEFGPVALTKDQCRDQDRVQWVDELVRNLRFAARRFARQPGLFLAVTVTLALCIGANAVIFGVVDFLVAMSRYLTLEPLVCLPLVCCRRKRLRR